MAKHVYPAILTNKDWQKKKGTLAKMAGKTGVGDAMNALEKSYKKVNWRIFDPGLALPNDRDLRNKEGLKMVIKNAQAEYKNTITSTVAPNLKDLKTKVGDARDEFKKSKTIPKKAAQHAEAVLSRIDEMEQEIAVETLVKELKDKAEQLLKDQVEYEKMMKGLKTKLKNYVIALAKDMKTVKTVEEFQYSWKENMRGIGTTLPVLAKELGLETVHKNWGTYINDKFVVRSAEEISGRYAQMAGDVKAIVMAIK